MDLFCTIETFFVPESATLYYERIFSGRYLCGVGLFRTIVNDSTHCVLFFCTRLDLFRTIETIFVRNRSIRVFLCFRGVQLEAHSTFFTTKNESKFVLCATGCTPRMDLFRTIKTFFVPVQKKFQ